MEHGVVIFWTPVVIFATAFIVAAVTVSPIDAPEMALAAASIS